MGEKCVQHSALWRVQIRSVSNQEKGKQENMDAWINPKGISKIFYIPRQDKANYCVIYDTKEEWVVYTPKEENTNFKCNHG